MADLIIPNDAEVVKYTKDFIKEYVQDNPFAQYTGKSDGAVIQMKSDFSQGPGRRVVFNLVNRLTGTAKVDGETMSGNEERMNIRNHEVECKVRRNAVVYEDYQQDTTAINLLQASRGALQMWAQEDTRDRVIRAMQLINGVEYGSASETQKDAWLADNSDRVLFGNAIANNSSNDHSASLANVTSSMTLSASLISLMKRIALNANPKIRPLKVEGQFMRFYVAFAHPRCFRDLKNDTVITAAQREVGIKAQNNKLFRGGDVQWDGVIIHEVDDMPILSGVGDSGIDVSPVVLCGAQAFCSGWRSRWTPISETNDYGERKGVGVRAHYEIDKARFSTGAVNSNDDKDHGMLTAYMPAVADG